jgi:hypothetical protein
LAAADPLESEPSIGSEPASSRALKRGCNYSHLAMIDMILAEPWISHDTLAERFGYSPSWISTVMATDAFKAQFAARKEELVDPALRATIDEQFEGILSRSMEIIREKLSQPPAAVGDQFVLRTMELSSRSLGYGARPDTKVEVNINNQIAEHANNLVTLLRRTKQEIIDGESTSTHPQSGPPHSGGAEGRQTTPPVQPALPSSESGGADAVVPSAPPL